MLYPAELRAHCKDLYNINKLLSINNKEDIEQIKNKMRMEIRNSLSKDKILNEEDKELIKKFISKIQKELNN